MSLSSRRSRRQAGVYRALRPQLESINRTMSNIVADGNCLFRAIAEGIGRSQAEYAGIKEQVIQFIRTNSSDFESFLEDPLDEYCRKLRGGKSYGSSMWGGHIELVALSRCLQLNIRIFRDGRSREFHYSPESTLIELAYNGSHYNLVLLIDEECQDDFSEHPLLANLDYERTGPGGDDMMRISNENESMDIDDPFERALNQPEDFSLGLPPPPPPMFGYGEEKGDGMDVDEQEDDDDNFPLHLAEFDVEVPVSLEKPDPAPLITNQLLACCHSIVYPTGTMKIAMENSDDVLGHIDNVIDGWLDHEKKKQSLTANEAQVIGDSLHVFKQENRKFVKKFFSPYAQDSKKHSTKAELCEVEQKHEKDIASVKSRMKECLGILREKKAPLPLESESIVNVISQGEEIDELFERFCEISGNGLVDCERRQFEFIDPPEVMDDVSKKRAKKRERHAKVLGELDGRVSKLVIRREAVKENASAILNFVKSFEDDSSAPFLNLQRTRMMSVGSEYSNHSLPMLECETGDVDCGDVVANDNFDAI